VSRHADCGAPTGGADESRAATDCSTLTAEHARVCCGRAAEAESCNLVWERGSGIGKVSIIGSALAC
jgi:hypothetical protein